MSSSTGISGDAPAHQAMFTVCILYAIPIFSLRLFVYLFRSPSFFFVFHQDGHVRPRQHEQKEKIARKLFFHVIQSFLSYIKNMDGSVFDTMTDRHTNLDLLEPRKSSYIEEKMICKLNSVFIAPNQYISV